MEKKNINPQTKKVIIQEKKANKFTFIST